MVAERLKGRIMAKMEFSVSSGGAETIRQFLQENPGEIAIRLVPQGKGTALAEVRNMNTGQTVSVNVMKVTR